MTAKDNAGLVERWELPFDFGGPEMTRHPSGNFVRFTDYEVKAAEITRLSEALDAEQAAYCARYLPEIRELNTRLQAATLRADQLSAVVEGLRERWDAAYRAFIGAFDTPLARRKQGDEFAEDARLRLRDFGEALSQSPPDAMAEIYPEAAIEAIAKGGERG